MSSDWEFKNITELVENLNYKRIPLSKVQREKKQGEYPYYGASGVFDYVDEYLFDGNYLLISEDGENLRTRKTPIAFKVGGKFWVNNHAHILAEKDEGVLDYLEYYFSILNINPYITGAVQPKLNRGNLEQINIRIPKKNLRLKINSILNSINNKIEKNNQINETLEAMAQAIFKSWFVDFDPVKAKISAREAGLECDAINRAAMRVIASKTDAELDEMQAESPAEYANLQTTASHFPDELVESELGMIPKGWEVSSFKDWVDIKRGKSITKAKVIEGIVPVVAGGLEPAYYHNEYNVKGPAITISASGANAGYVNLYFQNIWSSDSSYIDKENSKYFYTSYVCLKFYQDMIFKMQTGAAQPHIYPKDFERLNIVLGDDDLYFKVEQIFNILFMQINLNGTENKSLIELRDSLLPKLLSGEIEV